MANDIRIQELGSGDIGLFNSVRAGTFDNPIIPEQARAFLDSDLHKIVVAVSLEQVIGIATGVILLHPDKNPALFVNEVSVHEDFRRRGIARRLSRALIRPAQDRGIKGVWLATEHDNIAARALYRDIGGRETEGIVVYDWGGAMDPD